MIIETNIAKVTADILSRFKELQNPETVSRAAAAAVLPFLRERIHEEGLKPDGTAIGTYSPKYLAYRKRKGKGNSDKVIISFSRILQNSYSLAAQDNAYVIGNTSEESENKIKWMTEKYGNLWALSEGEQEVALIAAKDESNKVLNG